MQFVLSAAAALLLTPTAETFAPNPVGAPPAGGIPEALSLASPTSQAVAAASQRLAPGTARPQRPDNVETVHFTTQDRQQLHGDFWRPRVRGENAPAVLLIHDAGRDRSQFDDLALQLNRRGLAVLALDLRGHGASTSERADWKQSSEEERRNLWAFATRDVQAAATWLRQRPEVHSTNLNLVGIGAGSALVARHAARDENVRSLVLIRPDEDQFGFDLSADLRALEGLPAYVAAPSEARTQIRALLGPLDGSSSLQLNLIRNSDGPMLDTRLPRTLTTWVSDQALPRRGRG